MGELSMEIVSRARAKVDAHACASGGLAIIGAGAVGKDGDVRGSGSADIKTFTEVSEFTTVVLVEDLARGLIPDARGMIDTVRHGRGLKV